MGFFGTLLGFCGFGMGVSSGVVLGYFLFIYFQPTDVKDPEIRPLSQRDSESLMRMRSEIPLWVKNPDFDRVDWLNKFIETMWPYLDKAICNIIKATVAKPEITELTKKYKIESVEFEALTLGTLPPTFQGMKVYTTDEEELIMEPGLRWAGNPNITVVVKAFGLRATAQVIDLQVFALPRITLKPLVPSFPCFASILVSLMEKPHVDFGLKLLGADLMSIPVLYGLVQEIIKDQVANMYLWPNTLEVPLMDPKMASKSPVGILTVKVIRAMDLKKKDLFGKSDPYVKLKLADENRLSKKTDVKYNDLNPEWNNSFSFSIRDPETQVLELTVFDWEKVGKHEKMGMNVINLKDLKPDEPQTLTLPLLKTMDPEDPQNKKSRGQMVVEATYKAVKEHQENGAGEDSEGMKNVTEGNLSNKWDPDGGGILVVRIIEAQDVEGKHHTNPFAKVIFQGEVKKTKHIKKNRDPRWDEEFEFMCEEAPKNDKIHVEVFSKPSSIGIHSKENLGYVTIALADVVHNKRINEKYHLIDSKNGRILIELLWRHT